jgi:hypothetical protein
MKDVAILQSELDYMTREVARLQSDRQFLTRFLARMLNPEDYGWLVDPELRKEISEVLKETLK